MHTNKGASQYVQEYVNVNVLSIEYVSLYVCFTNVCCLLSLETKLIVKLIREYQSDAYTYVLIIREDGEVLFLFQRGQ